MVLSPLVGALLGLIIMVSVMWIFRRWSPHRVDRFFRKGQLVSAALFSLGHGGNDAQKTMGIIAGVLVASNLNPHASNDIPMWVVLICHAAIGLGTLSGGWRIVKTMGSRITKLKPVGGFSAESAAAAAIIGVTTAAPRSTTQPSRAHRRRRRHAKAVGLQVGRGRPIRWAWILTSARGALSALC